MKLDIWVTSNIRLQNRMNSWTFIINYRWYPWSNMSRGPPEWCLFQMASRSSLYNQEAYLAKLRYIRPQNQLLEMMNWLFKRSLSRSGPNLIQITTGLLSLLIHTSLQKTISHRSKQLMFTLNLLMIFIKLWPIAVSRSQVFMMKWHSLKLYNLSSNTKLVLYRSVRAKIKPMVIMKLSVMQKCLLRLR